MWQPIRPGGGRRRAGSTPVAARHDDDPPRPPRVLGAGTGRFIVTVAAPTNASGTGRPSSPSTAGIGRQIVILGGGQHRRGRLLHLVDEVRVRPAVEHLHGRGVAGPVSSTAIHRATSFAGVADEEVAGLGLRL